MPNGMRFAEAELAPSAEKEEAKFALSQLGDKEAVIANRMKGETTLEDLAEIGTEQKAIRDETAQLETQLRHIEALEQLGLEGADSTLRKQARDLIARREKAESEMKAAEKKLEALKAEIKSAWGRADTAEAILNAIVNDESSTAKIASLEGEVAEMKSRVEGMTRELDEMSKNELLKPFTIEAKA